MELHGSLQKLSSNIKYLILSFLIGVPKQSSGVIYLAGC